MATCPECKSGTYKKDFGCTSCGLGNPFRGIACLTGKFVSVQRPDITVRSRTESEQIAGETGYKDE